MARLYYLGAILVLLMRFTSVNAEPVAAEPVGRLFSSTRERPVPDQLPQKIGKEKAPILAPALPEPVDQITLDGFVRNSSGKTTIWINQVPQHENETPQGIALLKSHGKQPTIAMQLPSGKKLNLKAGQTFDITKGKVSEVYEDSAAPLQ